MKKFFIGIISLTILFILSTVAYASPPREHIQMDGTPTRPELRRPQSSEYLANCASKRIIDSNLTFESSSDASSFIQVDEGTPLENERGDQDLLDFEALLERLEE